MKDINKIGRRFLTRHLLLFVIMLPICALSQITISPTAATGCDKPDGKVEIKVYTSVSGFDFEYSIDGINFQSSSIFDNLKPGNYTATVRDKKSQCSYSKPFTIQGNLKVVISGSNGPISYAVCTSAPSVTLTASASGGSGSYNYSWPGGINVVTSSGAYQVIAEDTKTGCRGDATVGVVFVPLICSRDPNDIIGPLGYGPSKMIAKSKTYPYTIRFENDPHFATAPAQIVKINHPLDSSVNIFSLRLGDFGFAGMNFTVPPDKTFYSTRLNLVDSLGVLVDVSAGIDVTKREVFWVFESKDPVSGLQPKASLGFLPINDSTTLKGEGYVNYTVKAADYTQTGDSIRAKASIVFDINAPLETPSIYNTIDAVAPVSHMSALPTNSDSTSFALLWNGQDDPGGSGIRDYSIYASENSGPYKLYQSGITTTTAKFTGNAGSTYCFYTLANDNVGNQEPMKSNCEATIKITPAVVLPLQWLYFKGQQVNKDVLLNWATISEKNTKYFIIERSLNGTQFAPIGEIVAKGNNAQASNYYYTDKDATLLNVKVLFYRLRQVDIDGKFTYSVIVDVPLKQTSAAPIVTAYPNPFIKNITLQVLNVTATKESDHVALYTFDGRMLYSHKITVNGSSTVLLQDIPDLKAGVYLLKTSINEQLFFIKMVKL